MSQTNSNKKALATLIFVAIALQLAVLFFFMDPHNLFWPDPRENYAVAKNLANGLPYSTPDNESNLDRAIGYPYFLSLVIRIIGPDILDLRLVHVIFLPALLLLLFQLGRSWKNSTVGLLALMLGAFYPYYQYVPLTLYPESILIFLFVCIATVMQYARDNDALGWRVLLATLIACSVLVRPTAVFWIPVVLFYLLWKKEFKLRSIANTIIPISLIPLIFVSTWMIRNHDVHGMYFFTTKSSELLLNAYNENTLWNVKCPRLPEEIQKQLSQAGSIHERREIASNEAKKFILNNPGRASSIAFMQMLDIWNPFPRTVIQEGYGSKKIKLIPALAYGFVLSLAIAGLIRNRRNLFMQAMLLLLLLNTIINGFFVVSVRFRIVTDFALILAAASYLEYLLSKYFDRNREEKAA